MTGVRVWLPPRPSSALRRVQPVWESLGLLVTGAFWLAVAVWFSQQLHLNFDEAYNLNEAETWARSGRWGVSVNGQVDLFEPNVTSGPSLLLPIALGLRWWGTDLETVRLLSVGVLFVSGGLLWAAGRRFLRPGPALLFVWAVFATPGILFYGTSVMGEVAALSLVMAHVALWDRAVAQRAPGRQAALGLAAGALLGLALLAKVICALLLPALLWVSARLWLRERSWRHALRLALPLMAAMAVWLGWSLYQYGVVAGAGAEAFERWAYQTQAASQNLRAVIILGPPLRHLAAHWQEGRQHFGAILLVALAAGPVALLLRRRLGLRFARRLAAEPGVRVVQAAAVFWLVWFFLLSGPQAYNRHLVFGIVFVIFLMCRMIDCLPLHAQEAAPPSASPWPAPASALVLGGLVIALALNAMQGYTTITRYAAHARQLQAGQLAAAQWVKTHLPADAQLMGWGWWTPWSLAFLSGRAAGRAELIAITPTALSDYLVRVPEMALAPDPRFEAFVAQYGALLYADNGYEIYRLAPETAPIALTRLVPDHLQLQPGFPLRPPGAFGLRVEAERVVPGTVIYFDAAPVATTYISATVLTAYIPARLWAQPGTHRVQLRTPTRQSAEAVLTVALP